MPADFWNPERRNPGADRTGCDADRWARRRPYGGSARTIARTSQASVLRRSDVRSAGARPFVGGTTPTERTLPATARRELSRRLKRLLDVGLALPLLLLAAPVILVAMALIRLTSHGPPIFVQTRIGRNEEKFGFYKLRTMVRGASAMNGDLAKHSKGDVFFTVEDDPRVTPVGRFLRRWSIDELPQLVNVLKGDMSLVGPRPLMEEEIPALPRRLRRLRSSVRPGITGLWQVNGRNDCSDNERMDMDRRYVREWSLALDLEILARTVPAVITGRGAN